MSDSDEPFYDALDIDEPTVHSPLTFPTKRRRSSLHPLSGLASPILDPDTSPDASSIFTANTEAALSEMGIAPSVLINTPDEATGCLSRPMEESVSLVIYF